MKQALSMRLVGCARRLIGSGWLLLSGSWLLAVAGCGGNVPGPVLATGLWTGDLHAPELPSAIGLLAEVKGASSLELVVLEAMGFEGGTVTGLRMAADTLTFDWPAEERRCALLQDAAGAWEGECRRSDSSPWRLLLMPPALRERPVGHARSILARDDYTWTSAVHPWGRLHLPPAVDPHSDAASARAREIAEALAHAQKLLGGRGYDRPLDAFLVAGRPEVGALSGRPSGSTADTHGSTVILAGHGEWPTVMRHEIMHVLSINLWGVPPEPAAWIREGIATYAGGHCAGYGFHQLAAALMADGRSVPLRALVDDFYEHNDLVTYLQSASLFQYLYEQRGREYAREVWRTGLERAQQGAGRSLERLEDEWRAWLARPELRPGDVDFADLARGCG